MVLDLIAMSDLIVKECWYTEMGGENEVKMCEFEHKCVFGKCEKSEMLKKCDI